MAGTIRIKFVKDYVVKDAARTTYRAGQVYEFDDNDFGRASAAHFTKRGAAVELSAGRGGRAAAPKAVAASALDEDERKVADRHRVPGVDDEGDEVPAAARVGRPGNLTHEQREAEAKAKADRANRQAAPPVPVAAEEPAADEGDDGPARDLPPRTTKGQAVRGANAPDALKATDVKDGTPKSTGEFGDKPADYESWTLEELHAEAAKRELPGRSGLNKADLAKALARSDRKKG